MRFKGNEILLAVISAFFLVLSLIGVVWTFTSGLMGSGIDGIMLLFVGLLMAGIFALQLLYIARDAGWIKWPAAVDSKKAGAPATTATPSVSSAAKQSESPQPTGSGAK